MQYQLTKLTKSESKTEHAKSKSKTAFAKSLQSASAMFRGEIDSFDPTVLSIPS